MRWFPREETMGEEDRGDQKIDLELLFVFKIQCHLSMPSIQN